MEGDEDLFVFSRENPEFFRFREDGLLEKTNPQIHEAEN